MEPYQLTILGKTSKAGDIDCRARNVACAVGNQVSNQVANLIELAVFLCAQACARQMLKQGGGVIVNMSSESGKEGSQGQSAYSPLPLRCPYP